MHIIIFCSQRLNSNSSEKKILSTCFRETLSKFVIFLEYFRKATQNYFFPFFLSCNFIFLPNECPGLCQAFKECTSKHQIRITLGATLFLGLHRHHRYTERTISQVVSPFIGVKSRIVITFDLKGHSFLAFIFVLFYHTFGGRIS